MINRFDRRGIGLVQGKQDQPQTPYFRVYEDVPYNGVYRVFHSGHRVSHDVILKAGEVFPRCNKCGEDVTFQLIQPVSGIRSASDHDNIRLYEIPHPEVRDSADLDSTNSGEAVPGSLEKKTA